MPCVSIIVPFFNAENYILDTLESIKAQSFQDFDVHVVDDCSTDRSPQIVSEFCHSDSRFYYYRTSANFGGPAGPRNLGVSASKGEFIAFCDADDLWMPHKLETQCAVFAGSNAAMLCAVIRDFTDGETLPSFEKPKLPVAITEISHNRLLLKNWIAMSSVMVRRTALTAAGDFNIAKSHVAVEDYDMWLRITRKGGRVLRIGVPLVHYRKLPTSISASKTMMIRKALNVIGEDYAQRGKFGLFRLARPLHWMLYVGTSAWMRAVRKEL